MSATDAAAQLAIIALRADAVLSLPFGAGPGQSLSGVNGGVYLGNSDTDTDVMFPRGTQFPAIAVIPISSPSTINGSGRVIMTSGLLMVKIVTVGMNVGAGRRIAERVDVVLAGIRRATWQGDGADAPTYYVAQIAPSPGGDIYQPSQAIGDRVYQYRNQMYRIHGNPR